MPYEFKTVRFQIGDLVAHFKDNQFIGILVKVYNGRLDRGLGDIVWIFPIQIRNYKPVRKQLWQFNKI